MTTVWQGHYLDGQTAIRHPVTVRVMREGLEVTVASGWTRVWPYRDVRQTQGYYAGEAVRLERQGPPGGTLVVADPGFLASLHDLAPELAARFHDPRGRARRVRLTALAVLAVVALAAGLYAWGIPSVAAVVAPRVPARWEAALGQAALDGLAPPAQRCVDPAAQATLDRLASRLAAAGDPLPYPLRVHLVDEPLVNAYALPGGSIVVFRGLLARLRSPEELAGVLAHEYQHIARRHALQAIIQSGSSGLLLTALTGDMTGPLVYGLQAARALGDLSYSRRAEEEADARGLQQLAAAGIDPAAMVAFQEAMLENEGAPSGPLRYLSTHPATRDRVDRLRALAVRHPAVALAPLASAAEWNELKRACRDRPRPAP